MNRPFLSIPIQAKKIKPLPIAIRAEVFESVPVLFVTNRAGWIKAPGVSGGQCRLRLRGVTRQARRPPGVARGLGHGARSDEFIRVRDVTSRHTVLFLCRDDGSIWHGRDSRCGG